MSFRWSLFALAQGLISILTADVAKPFTAFRAYWNKRKMQDYFLSEYLGKINSFVFGIDVINIVQRIIVLSLTPKFAFRLGNYYFFNQVFQAFTARKLYFNFKIIDDNADRPL